MTAPDESPDPPAPRVRRESTAEQVATALRDLIVAGTLTPGYRLREGPLSGQLGVSRNTTREALHILVSQGLVRREIHRGAYVTEFDADDVRDMIRVRSLVEGAAVRELAARKADLTALTALVDAIAEAIDAGEGSTKVLEADLRFHEALVEHVESDRLGALYEAVSTELAVCVVLSAQAEVPSQSFVRDLRSLLSAIRKGEGERAVAVLQKHLEAGQQRLLERFA